MSDNLKNSTSSFAVAMKEVFGLGEKAESISAKVLFAMFDMETTFDNTWLKNYCTAVNKDKTAMIDKALLDLSPEYSEIQELASTKVTDIRKETNPAKKQRMEADKASAQAKQKAAQNLLRNAALALVYLRSVTIDKLTLTDRKRIKWSVKGQGWFNMLGCTFKEVVDLGKGQATELGWIEAKPENTNSSEPSSGAANKGTSIVDTAKTSNLQTIVKSLAATLKTMDFDKLPEEDQNALSELEQALVIGFYADKETKKVDLKLLTSFYKRDDEKKADRAKVA